MPAVYAAAETFQFTNRNNPEADGRALPDKIVIMLNRLSTGKSRPTSAFHVIPGGKRLEYALNFVLCSLGEIAGSANAC